MLLEKIRELHRERDVSFLISTHTLPELEKVCNWVSIVKGGRIVDQGPIDKLAEKYSANIYKIEVSEPAVLIREILKFNSVKEARLEKGVI